MASACPWLLFYLFVLTDMDRRRKSSLDPLSLPTGMIVHGGQGMVVPKLSSAILRRHSESHVHSFFFGTLHFLKFVCSLAAEKRRW